MASSIFKTMLPLLALLGWQACSLVELEDASDSDEVWISTVPEMGSLYAVGVQYPEDYDWRDDPDGVGERPCSLFVWQSGRIVMRIAAGAEHEVSIHPDSYRLIGGVLYTDCSSGSETVIKANGKELFRYPGREYLVGFKVDSTGVYTLGNSRSGKGFSYRKNGELIIGDGRSTAWPHLEGNVGNYAFCYWKPMTEEGRTTERISVSRYAEGEAVAVEVVAGVKRIYDAAVVGRETVMAVQMEEDPTIPVLLKGKDRLWLDSSAMRQEWVTDCRLYPQANGEIYVHSVIGRSFHCLWKDNGLLSSRSGFSDLLALSVYGKRFLAYLPSVTAGSPDCVLDAGLLRKMPSFWSVMGSRPVCLWQGKVYVALCSRIDRHPAIWCDGELMTLPVNGYLYEVGVGK